MPNYKPRVTKVPAPIPTQLTSESDPDELMAVIDVLEWRHSLDDMTVRSMAADYLRGDRDACNTDAFHEYEHRFGKVTKSQRKHGKKSKAIRPHQKRA
jgi:hypothetical protein